MAVTVWRMTLAVREDFPNMLRRRRGATTPFKFDRRKKYGFVSQKELKQLGCATVWLPILPLLVVALVILVMQ